MIAVAHVVPNASPETIRALSGMTKAAQRARQFAAPLLRVEAGFQAAVLAAHLAAIRAMRPIVEQGGTPDDAGRVAFNHLYPALVKLGQMWFPRALREGWAQGNARLAAVVSRRKKSWVDDETKAPRKPGSDVQTIFDLEWPEIAEYIRSRPIAYAPIAARTTVDMFRAQLVAGVEDGLGIASIVRNILGQQLPGISRWRATTIARTECLPGETFVDGAVVRAVYRRWYIGPLVEIRTRAGRYLRATPNHPMLTRRGWVAAGLLCESDDLVCDAGQQDARATRDRNEDHRPAPIAEVFRALSGVARTERTRSSHLDFHGDGMNGEVDVLRPLRPLSIGVFSPLTQETVEASFAPADQTRALCCGACGYLRPVDESVHRCTRSAGNSGVFQTSDDSVEIGVERCGDPLDRFVGEIASPDLQHGQIGTVIVGVSTASVERFAGIASGAAFCADDRQYATDPLSADVHGIGDQGYRFPGCVTSRDLFRVDVASERPMAPAKRVGFFATPSYTERLHEPKDRGRATSGAVAELPRDSLGCHPGLIEFDRVSRVVRRESWSGHVFNLSTDDGYFSVDQVYTGNTLSAGNSANFANYKASGVVQKKRWLDTSDTRTREQHRTRAWKAGRVVVPIDQPFVLPDGSRLQFPGDASLEAPLSAYVNCRCSIGPEVSMPGIPDFVPGG